MGKEYSRKKDGNVELSPHFKVREFWTAGDEIRIDEELIDRLEALYEELDCSKIIITSGYRPGEAGSQHALGKAADVNCWHKTATGEERYQGKEILLAAEKVGFRGIGWIAGSAASRAAVHLDTREKAYRFDEADGNRMVKDNSWYAYFGLEKPADPGAPAAPPDISYQAYIQGRGWLPAVTNCGEGPDGYAGIYGEPISGVYAWLSAGSVKYRLHSAGRWLPWVVDRQDYAGILGTQADGVQMQLVDLPGYSIQYRAADTAGKYWAWVTDYGEGSEGYAGSFGKPFTGLQCRIVRA